MSNTKNNMYKAGKLYQIEPGLARSLCLDETLRYALVADYLQECDAKDGLTFHKLDEDQVVICESFFTSEELLAGVLIEAKDEDPEPEIIEVRVDFSELTEVIGATFVSAEQADFVMSELIRVQKMGFAKTQFTLTYDDRVSCYASCEYSFGETIKQNAPLYRAFHVKNSK